MKKTKILVASANPTGGLRAAATEIRTIEDAIRLAPAREELELLTCVEARWSDLRNAISAHRPHIVHFAGHGARDRGLVFSDGAGGDGASVSIDAVCTLLRALPGTRLVLLNACDTARHVDAILEVADHAIAMDGPVSDFGANLFAEAFYSALASRHDVPVAFQIGLAEMQARSPADVRLPIHRSRDRVARLASGSFEHPDRQIAVLSKVQLCRNLFPELPRDLADALTSAFPTTNQVVMVVTEAEQLMAQAAPHLDPAIADYRLRIGQVPLDSGAVWAWRSIVRDAAAISPQALLAILLVARARVATIPAVEAAIRLVQET